MSKFYITTSIPYANANPHIGHVLDPLYADVLNRYYKSKGVDSFFLAGLDENGQKVYEKAKENGVSVEEWANGILKKFEALNAGLNNNYDGFIRTSDTEKHHTTAQEMWRRSKEKGDIYKKNYHGLYCVGCESFKIKEELVEGKCPDHLTAPEEVDEENYFFALSKYQDFLLNHFEKNPDFVYPKSRYNEAYQMIKSGLEDISISRPKTRLPWGVPVPDDSDHVMYVWFDALTNYLSGIGFTSDREKFEKYWPQDLQIVGKDNNRWHSILWPAMLKSADLELPKKTLVHGYILAKGGVKMSKTIGNVVDPFEIIEKYGADAFRYFLILKIGIENDGIFDEEYFKEVVNADLANGLGNLVQRVAGMITKYFDGEIPEGETLLKLEECDGLIEGLELDKALDHIWANLRKLDQYIEVNKPWELAKNNDPKLKEVLGNLAKSILDANEHLKPFLPETAKKISKIYNKKINLEEPLFPRID